MGIGVTEFSKKSGRSALGLALEAVTADGSRVDDLTTNTPADDAARPHP